MDEPMIFGHLILSTLTKFLILFRFEAVDVGSISLGMSIMNNNDPNCNNNFEGTLEADS